MIDFVYGAGEGNRTLVVSLEGFCSTIELHPHLTTSPEFATRFHGPVSTHIVRGRALPQGHGSGQRATFGQLGLVGVRPRPRPCAREISVAWRSTAFVSAIFCPVSSSGGAE